MYVSTKFFTCFLHSMLILYILNVKCVATKSPSCCSFYKHMKLTANKSSILSINNDHIPEVLSLTYGPWGVCSAFCKLVIIGPLCFYFACFPCDFSTKKAHIWLSWGCYTTTMMPIAIVTRRLTQQYQCCNPLPLTVIKRLCYSVSS